jgi:hypothetical protein
MLDPVEMGRGDGLVTAFCLGVIAGQARRRRGPIDIETCLPEPIFSVEIPTPFRVGARHPEESDRIEPRWHQHRYHVKVR